MPTNSLPRLFSSTSGNIGKAGCRPWSRAKLAFGIAFAGIAMTAGQAQAVVVNVGGQDWDVTQFYGDYLTNAVPFQTPANGGVMPWMGSASLANEFTNQVNSQLGSPNSGGAFGPLFGYELPSPSGINVYIFNGINVAPCLLWEPPLPSASVAS